MSDKLFQKRKKKVDDLKRKQVKQAAFILAVCEGETEGDYIRHLRKAWDIENKIHLIDATQHICLETFSEIRTAPPKVSEVKYGSSPISVVDYAIAVAEKRKTPFKPYEYIFCLFDKDDPAKYAEACQRKKAVRGGQVIKITSVPCFEYWLLLHFEETNSPLGSESNTIKRLREHLIDYSHSNKRIDKDRFELLNYGNNIENAIKLSKSLFDRQSQTNTDDPTTKMYELMNELAKWKPAKH